MPRTPVVASPLGAAPEIVRHGVNGYLCAGAVVHVAFWPEGLDTPGEHAKVDVETRGGVLTIEWAGGDSHVFMTGPAVTVFEGEIEL